PPETSPRLFAPRVPARCAFSSARTVSWTRCDFRSAANTSPSRVTCLAALPAGSRSGALTALAMVVVARVRLLLPDLDDAVLRAGDGALDEQQVLLGVDLDHLQAHLGDALAAEAAGHPHALEHARRGRRSTDGAWLADVVGAVRLGATVE